MASSVRLVEEPTTNNSSVQVVGEPGSQRSSVRVVDEFEGPPAVPAVARTGVTGRGGSFVRGVRRGTSQSIGLAGQLLRSIGDETGFAGAIELGDELIQEAFVEAVSNPARIEGLDDIDSFSKAGTFIAQTLGEQVFNIALAGVGAAVGAAVGASTGGAGLVGLGGFLTRASVGKAAVQGIAKKAALRKAKLTGAAAGTFTAFLPINTGEILQEQRDHFESQVSGVRGVTAPELGPSLALGAVSSALEVLGFGLVGKAIFGAAKKEVVESMVRTVLRRVGHASLKSLAAEGGTEAVQEVLVIASKKLNDPIFSIADAISSSEGLSRIAFAGVSGAVVGGILGGGGGVATGVGDATRVGLQRANLRDASGDARRAAKETFNREETAEGEEEQVRSLFDLDIARKQIATRVEAATKIFKELARTIRNRKSNPETVAEADVEAVTAAAREQQQSALQDLDFEDDALDLADGKERENRGRIELAVAKIRQVLGSIETPTAEQPRTARQNKATAKAAKTINELIAKIKGLSVDERAAAVEEGLAEIEKQTSKALSDPFAVPVDRVRVLLNLVNKSARAGFKKTQKSIKKAKSMNKFHRGRLNRLGEQLSDTQVTEPAATEQQAGTTTSVAEVLRSIEAVVQGTKQFAFAVGATLQTLPTAVKTAIGRGQLSVRQEEGRVIIAKAADINKDANAESFAEDVSTLGADAVVATTRDEAGGVVSNEAVSPAEAATRADTEVRGAAEAITESVSELNDQAENSVKNRIRTANDLLSKVFRAVTAWQTKNPNKDITKVPGDLVLYTGEDGFPVFWSEFKENYQNAEYLAGVMMDLSTSWADPDTFIETSTAQTVSDVEDLQDKLKLIHDGRLSAEELFNTVGSIQEQPTQLFVRAAGNGKLVAAEATDTGIQRESGKGTKPITTQEEAARVRNLPSSRKIFGDDRVDTVEIEGEFFFQVTLPEGRIPTADRQVRTALRRGTKQSNKGKGGEFVVSGRKILKRDETGKPTKFGGKVWFHLGEITQLGYLISDNRTTTFDKVANAHQHFLAGMAALEVDYSYQVDFDSKRDANKFIYGRATFKNSFNTKDALAAIKNTWLKTGDKTLVAEAIAFLMSQPGKIQWNTIADWLIDEAHAGRISPKDIEGVLWDQGIFDESLIVSLTAELEDSSEGITLEAEDFPEGGAAAAAKANEAAFPTGREGEEARAGTRFGEDPREGRTSIMDEPVQNAVRNLNLGFVQQGIHKATGQVANFLTNPDNSVWEAAQAAVEFTLKMLGIKEEIVLVDEFSAPGVITVYKIKERNATSKKQAATYRRYHRRLQKALDEEVIGRIMPPPHDTAKKDRIINIFVSKTRRGRKKESRGLILMHEIGHLVQYTHLNALSPKLKQLILGSLAENGTNKQKQEAFANWMAKVAVDIHFGRKVRTGNAVDDIFTNIVKDLKQIWTKLKGILGYPNNFAEFVTALNTHAAAQRGEQVAAPTTALAKQIFLELQDANAGAYISDAAAAPTEADMTIEADAEQRSEDSVFKSYVENFQAWARRLRDKPTDAIKMLVYTSDSELRGMGKFGEKLAKMFHALPSSVDKSLTVFREIMQRAAPFHSALQRVLNSVPGSRIGLWEQLYKKGVSDKTKGDRKLRAEIIEALLLQTPSKELRADLRPHVAVVRAYLRELHTWYTEEMGLDLGLRKDYYPMMLDSLKIENNRAQFIEILRRHDFTEEGAQKQRQKLTRDEDGGLNNGFQEDINSDFLGPGFSSKKRRANRSKWTDALRRDLVEAGFYQEDMATTLIAYTEMAVRRAVWQKRFQVLRPTRIELKEFEAAGLDANSPVAGLQIQIHRAHRSGEINDWQRDRISKDILPAYAGQLGLRTNSHIRKLSSGIVIYQNLRLLSLALFSSFVDVGTLMARGGWHDHQAGLRLIIDKASRDDAFEMLEAIGAMRQGLTEHVLNDQALNTFMTGSAKRINDLFFHYNGMEGWTNLMRAMGMVSAREFMQRNARKAQTGDATAQRYLDELDITVKEVTQWDGHSTSSLRINAALNRYIDEAMIRPDPTIRPVWMSDPGYGVFAHLKGFLYGFHETFLRRVGREARIHQNLLPLLALGMLALPFAAVGYELRRKLTGSKNAPEGFDYFKEVVERSGLPGAFQLVVDMEQADDFGKPFGLGIGGPAVEQLYDFLTKDVESVIPKAIPIVAQSPVARDWVRDRLE